MSSAKINNNENKPIRRSKSTLSIKALDAGIDYENQSTEDTTEPGARISLLVDPDEDFSSLDGAKTVYDCFQRGRRKAGGDGNCLGWKPDSTTPFKWLTYDEVDKRATDFGAGLLALGLKANNETRVGIYSQNRPEYLIADQAFARHSICGVALYDTLGEEAGNFIINHAEMTHIVCDNDAKVEKLLNRLNWIQKVDTIIVMDAISEMSKEKAESAGRRLIPFTEVEEMGRKHPAELTLPNPNDVYFVCFTSGTTGTPKGAMISHSNIIANMVGCRMTWDKFDIQPSTEDVLFSYLPLAHMYERMCECVMLSEGSSIGFFQGDVKKLSDDMLELKPTFFPSVPRLLNRMYDKIVNGVNASRVKKMLFNMAVKSKKKDLEKGNIRNNSFWDKIVFHKIHALLGGRVRLITTGSAPLSAEVLTLLRCVMGCPVIEGYGQTECTAIATINMIGDSKSGHVGPPLPGVKVKLCDVPDMNYFAKDNKGEVCVKSPSVIKGYLKNEEKTREILDDDGWLHTGDVGQWLPNGCLKIIDRKKHIFKLAQGEYIAPEKIENILLQSAYLAQVFVHGNSLESWLVGIVVPDPETLPDLASKLGVTGKYEEIAKSPVVKKAILTDIVDISKKNGLTSLEQLKEIHVHTELFSVENGFLTPTFKSKRNEIVSHFEAVFREMYDKTKSTAL